MITQEGEKGGEGAEGRGAEGGSRTGRGRGGRMEMGDGRAQCRAASGSMGRTDSRARGGWMPMRGSVGALLPGTRGQGTGAEGGAAGRTRSPRNRGVRTAGAALRKYRAWSSRRPRTYEGGAGETCFSWGETAEGGAQPGREVDVNPAGGRGAEGGSRTGRGRGGRWKQGAWRVKSAEFSPLAGVFCLATIFIV